MLTRLTLQLIQSVVCFLPSVRSLLLSLETYGFLPPLKPLRLLAEAGGRHRRRRLPHCSSEDEAEIETDEAHSDLKCLKPAEN